MSTDPRTTLDRDRAAIEAHVHGLFTAFLAGDREAIRRGHSADWRGFLMPSRRLLRGIDDYMRAAEDVLQGLRAVRYEMLEIDVQVAGDDAVVFYVARDHLREADGSERTVLLRSVDLYRRDRGGWIQCGSHICALPDPQPG